MKLKNEHVKFKYIHILLIMNNIINELGIYLNSVQVQMLDNCIHFLFDNRINDLRFTCSSGASIVISDSTNSNSVVYQYYLSDKTYKKVLEFCKHKIDGFVQMQTFYDAYNIIVFDRIEPIVNLHSKIHAFDKSKLLNDIFTTLVRLKKLQISHNDLTLDNIGYSKVYKQYLIYDFETVKFDTDNSTDLYTFLNSVHFHTTR